MRRGIAAIAAVVLLLGSVGNVAASGGPKPDHGKTYYVSVGDSLAAGVQPIGDAADKYRTDEGYAEQLLAIAQHRSPRLSLVKLGCPGETTTTLIEGGICSYRHGSQLDEAVSFLRAHRGHVAFVTIDIGANDFPCQEARCFPAGVANIQGNLPGILDALRKAAGRDVPIVGMTIYNPFLAAWLLGAEGQAYARVAQTELMGPLNDLLRGLYKADGARVADVEGAFSSDDFSTMVAVPGAGTIPLNVARICTWTWVCAPGPLGPDNHANATGYGVIARAFAASLRLR
jgi:lysophospholipase L1-like esterase